MRIDEMLLRKKELGYSYKQIASLSGVPLGTVQKVLGGCTKSPRYDTLQALERALSVSSANLPAPERAVSPLSQPEGELSPAAASAKSPALMQVPPSMLCEPSPAYQIGTPGVHSLPKKQKGDASDKAKAGKDVQVTPEGSSQADERGITTLRSGWIDPARQGTYTIADRDLLPDDIRTELIDGVIYVMASPRVIHQAISAKLTSMFLNMISSRRGSCMAFSAPMDVVLDEDKRTVVQPDVLIVCDRERLQGRWVFGAPDLVVEIISPSSRGRDYFLKARKYGNAGVREYWIIDPKKQKVVVYLFERGTVKPPDEEADFEIGLYTFETKIPVGIFGEGVFLDFSEVYDYIRDLT